MNYKKFKEIHDDVRAQRITESFYPYLLGYLAAEVEYGEKNEKMVIEHEKIIFALEKARKFAIEQKEMQQALESSLQTENIR